MTFDPFPDFTGLLMLAQRIQVTGEVAGRGQGVGVVDAQDTHPTLRKSAKLRDQPSPTGNATAQRPITTATRTEGGQAWESVRNGSQGDDPCQCARPCPHAQQLWWQRYPRSRRITSIPDCRRVAWPWFTGDGGRKSRGIPRCGDAGTRGTDPRSFRYWITIGSWVASSSRSLSSWVASSSRSFGSWISTNSGNTNSGTRWRSPTTATK